MGKKLIVVNGETIEERRVTHDRRDCPYECDRAEVAADQAVVKVFNILGVDVTKAEQVERFRIGLRFGETMHKVAERGMMAMVVVVSVAMAGAFLIGVVYKVKNFLPNGGQ